MKKLKNILTYTYTYFMLTRLTNKIKIKKSFSTFIKDLKISINERKLQQISPKILNYTEVQKLCEEIKIENDEKKKKIFT